MLRINSAKDLPGILRLPQSGSLRMTFRMKNPHRK
jgi:hypothetical protein